MNTAALATEYALAPAATPTEAEMGLFRQWLDSQWQRIAKITRFTPAEVDPAQFLIRVQNTGQLLISTAHNDHPFWTGRENARFRAVHDMHHLLTGARFDWAGEVAAFEHACATAPEQIHWILRSEILLQAASALETGVFPPQKLVRV